MSLCLSLLAVQWHFLLLFFLKQKHTLCYRDTVKANLILSYLIFFINKHHIGKSNLCHAEIIYPIIDIVLLSNILWMLFEEKIDWFDLQSVLIHKS